MTHPLFQASRDLTLPGSLFVRLSASSPSEDHPNPVGSTCQTGRVRQGEIRDETLHDSGL